jgi:hypothetical protein
MASGLSRLTTQAAVPPDFGSKSLFSSPGVRAWVIVALTSASSPFRGFEKKVIQPLCGVIPRSFCGVS